MAEQEAKPRVPSALKRLVDDYLNTCHFMTKMWRGLIAVLAVAFPVAFILRESNLIQALVNAVGFWLLAAVASRLAVLEFRILRAAWVAKKIDRRIPEGHPSREGVIEWIRDRNDGNFLNSLLKKLGAAPHPPPVIETTTSDPTAFINGVLAKLGGQQQQTTTTYVYGNSITQVLNEEGEWVTIQESQPVAVEGPPPEQSVQRALEELAPPENFKPIPIAAPGPGKEKKKKSKSKKKKRRSTHLLLDPEAYDPEAAGEGRESG
jgi:hypothetical protein